MGSPDVSKCFIGIAQIEFATPFSVRKRFVLSVLLKGLAVGNRFRCEFGSQRDQFEVICSNRQKRSTSDGRIFIQSWR